MREANTQYVFYAFNPEYGLGRRLLSVDDKPPFSNWALSPDGSLVALVHNRGPIRIITLATGHEREVAKDGWVLGEFVAWAKDGKGLFIDGSSSSYIFRKALVYFSIETGEAVEIRRVPNQWHVRPQVSPDGKHIAFGLMVFSGNAWMIENP